MNAAALALALNGRRSGACWMARCPVHDDQEPSLSISERNGVVLVHCHAGCAQAEVIAELRARGLWSGSATKGLGKQSAGTRRNDNRDDEARRQVALKLWADSKAAGGTLVERYLRSRSILIPAPPTLRFHPGLRHRSGGIFPGMMGLVTRGGADLPVGLHRTFLRADGCGKAAVSPEKMMLGRCVGGVVRLAPANRAVMIGEGIETCLSAVQATGQPAWATLSASGLRNVELPPEIDEVIVLADGDEPGEAAATACAARLRRAGRVVRIARPPAGSDFNDVLMTGAPATRGETP